MRLLVITNNLERPDFRQRIQGYLDILRDHDLACEIAQLPADEWRRWKLFRSAAQFDGVFVHKKLLSWWDALWLRRYSRRIIYSFDDAIMYRGKNPEVCSRSRFLAFRRTVRMANQVIVGSSYLAEHARRFNSRVEVLPIGLPVDDYGAEGVAREDGKVRLVWIGSRSSLDYLGQLGPVLKAIGTRSPHAVLRIISDSFVEPFGLPVEKLIWSPENRRIGLASSDIGLAPLPDNPFTRGKCTFKVLEYSASGLPVIASPVGTNPDHVIEGVTGFLVSGDAAWLDRATRLIENPELRRQMGERGRRHAAQYDSKRIGARLAELLRTCLADRPAVDSAGT